MHLGLNPLSYSDDSKLSEITYRSLQLEPEMLNYNYLLSVAPKMARVDEKVSFLSAAISIR